MATLRYPGWQPEEVDRLLDIVGEQNAKDVMRGRLKVNFEVVDLTLDCSKPFDVRAFLGEGWSVWRGLATGNGMSGDPDIDTRADELIRLNFLDALFVKYPTGGDSFDKGEAKLSFLKEAGDVRLGGRHFLALWNEYQQLREHSVLEHLWMTEGISHMDFTGLVLRSPSGDRRVPYLNKRGGWHWECLGFESVRMGQAWSACWPAG